MFQIPILVSVRQLVLLFLNLVNFPKIGDNDVTAGSQNLKNIDKITLYLIFMTIFLLPYQVSLQVIKIIARNHESFILPFLAQIRA